uniref:Response regulatory domain-containing protein n=1 Tax=Leersia perrieri TaxID=77586 RepID=A0A0D9XID5_9ORYZ
MEEQTMLSFFPGGLRLMMVDDNTEAENTPNYPVVATCSTACAGMQALFGDKVVDVQAVLCDMHKVVSSGIDFRRIVETNLRIPVIYLLSMEDTTEDDELEFLDYLLQTSTYIVRKPLNHTMMTHLWRVVAWRKCYLEENMATPTDEDAAEGGGEDGDDVIIVEEPQVHLRAMRCNRNQKRGLDLNDEEDNSDNTYDSADARPRKILEHMNVKGLKRQHVASYLQKYRKKQQKKDNQQDERSPLRSWDPLLLKDLLPMLKAPPLNPLILNAGGAGPSSVVAAALPADGSVATVPFEAPVQQHQQTHLSCNTAINFNSNTAINYNDNASISFSNAASPVPAKEQQQSGGVQLDVDLQQKQQKLSMGPFSYQGPTPPAMENRISLLMDNDEHKSPLIELPFGQPVDDLLIRAGSLMAPPIDASGQIAATEGQGSGAGAVVVASEENAATAAPNIAEPNIVPDLQVAADAAPIASEGDITFTLEEILGLDDDVAMPLEDGGADAAAAAGSEEGGMDNGWDIDLDLDWLNMDNSNDVAFPLDDELAGSD